MTVSQRHDASEIVIGCPDLDLALDYLTKHLGFRLDAIFPADAPRVAVVSGLGNRIRLEQAASNRSLRLRVFGAAPDCDPPPGLDVEFVEDASALLVPPLAADLVVSYAADSAWGTGRAGMQYRDLLPGRYGGRFIASHIRIQTGGPVPDYVHHHGVRFQMIYCRRGWVRVVYEDQGDPFVMHEGDCVLQPPYIRHQVLECSDRFEVVEIGSPAEHETLVDHELPLPTAEHRPQRDFGGQRFVRHTARDASWASWRDGFEMRDTGIAAATGGTASAIVVRAAGAPAQKYTIHGAEFVFNFVLSGTATLRFAEHDTVALGVDDAAAIPAGIAHAFGDTSHDFEMLEVALPADYRSMPTDASRQE